MLAAAPSIVTWFSFCMLVAFILSAIAAWAFAPPDWPHRLLAAAFAFFALAFLLDVVIK